MLHMHEITTIRERVVGNPPVVQIFTQGQVSENHL